MLPAMSAFREKRRCNRISMNIRFWHNPDIPLFRTYINPSDTVTVRYSDGEKRYFRTKFKAQNGKTENEIALENRVFRVYGCGSNIYELKLF